MEFPDKLIDVVSLTQDFVKINTENAVNNEDDLGTFIEQLLAPYGFQFFHQSASPGRTNLLAVLEEKEENIKKEIILFSGHLDTVLGYEVNNSAKAEIANGNIYGRGTCDMKGGIAAFIAATLKWINTNRKIIGSKGIALAFTVDEEAGCMGMHHMDTSSFLNVFSRVKYCILAEPSYLIPLYAHKGINWYYLTFKGIAAHASVPEKGKNAIYSAVHFTQKLLEYEKELLTIDSPLGHPKLNVGTISGGSATNIVPNECNLTIDRRFVPNEEPSEDEKHIHQLALSVDPDVIFKPKTPGYAYFLPEGNKNPIYQQIAEICTQIREKSTSSNDSNHSLDFSLPAYTEADLYYRKYKIPTIILGPGGIYQAHQTPEFIAIEQLEKAVQIYMKILDTFFKLD
jgi:acetylornithine deacetylase/succinyl-diaminopimelate desuccinylase-like protein